MDGPTPGTAFSALPTRPARDVGITAPTSEPTSFFTMSLEKGTLWVRDNCRNILIWMPRSAAISISGTGKRG
jgi:hypothetical protein